MPDASAVNWSKEQVIAYAAEHGHAITLSQFDRWRKRGLLPSPVLTGRGRGFGVRASYPQSAGPQLVAVCEQLDTNRSVERALWHLWWNGFPIDVKHPRATLEAVLSDIELRGRVGERLMAEDGQDFAAEVEASALAGGTNHDVGRVRRRLGKARYPTFYTMLFEIASGAYESQLTEDADFIARGLGVDASPVVTPRALQVVSRYVHDHLRSAFESAQSNDLCSARDEVRLLLGRAQAIVQQQPERFFETKVEASVWRMVADEAQQPSLVLLWLPVHLHPLFPTLFRFFARTLLPPLAKWPEGDISLTALSEST